MSRVKIEDLKPPAKDLDVKEMKKLYGGINIVGRGRPGLSSCPLVLGSLEDETGGGVSADCFNCGSFT